MWKMVRKGNLESDGGKKHSKLANQICFSCTEAEMGNALQCFTELLAKNCSEQRESVGLDLAVLGSARRELSDIGPFSDSAALQGLYQLQRSTSRIKFCL